MSNSVFSLRLLPDNVRLHVIKSFEYPELIAFSLISTKAKSLVKSFKMKIKALWVVVEEDSLNIGLDYYSPWTDTQFKIYYDKGNNNEALISLDEIPSNIETSSWVREYKNYTYSTWKNPGLSCNKWFQHICCLFKSEKSRISFGVDQEVFDTVAIWNLLPEWTTINIDDASIDYAQKIFDLFSTCTKNFDLRREDNISKFPQKVGIQNFDFLNFPQRCTLDDLLVLNAIEIVMYKLCFSDVNRFLKSWIHGSNPRLRHASLYLENEEYEDIESKERKVLKGIQYQEMPDDLERKMKNDTIRGGIDIQNKKGISATIIVKEGRTSTDVEFYV